jgi:predicted outer membrane protein
MLAEHSAALDRGAELAARLGLLPATSDTSARLAAMTDQTIATLDATSEFQIDVVYMDSQIQMHAEVLRIIDQELLPNATAFELRDELVRTRAAVAAHLDEAQAVRDDLFVFTGMAKR